MEESRIQRKFLRAPISSTALYVDGENVLRGKVVNLSEGGLLLSELPRIPDNPKIFIAFDLCEYPLLSTLAYDKLKLLSVHDFEKTIVKAQIKMVRNFEKLPAVDRIFMANLGCEFIQIDTDAKILIFKYIEQFAKNIVYLLGLFETMGKKSEQLELLKKVAELLGYNPQMKLSILRAKVLHDYQGLESL